MAAMRTLAIPPGEYVLPHAGTTAAMNDPAYREKVQAGPVAFLTVLPNELPRMGKSLLLWFVYCLVVGTFAGYVTSRALGPGADYRWRSSALPEPWRSSAIPSPTGRTQSGTHANGARRPRTPSMDWSTRC